MSTYDWAANRVRWAKLFVSPLKKLVRKLSPSSSFAVSDGALAMLDERIYNILAHLCSVRGSFPTTRAAAEDAIERLFPESVSEWILEGCRAAVAAQSASRRKSEIKRLFPVDKVHSLLKKEVARDPNLPSEVALILVTAVEELAFEILKFAVSYAQQLQETVITEETLQVTMEARLDLSAITSRCTAPPTVQAYIKLSYSEAVRECLIAENNFVSKLDAISKVFVDTLESQFEVPESTIAAIFSNTSDLHEIAQNLATDLEDVIDKGNIHKSLPVVGETFYNFTETKEYENFVFFATNLPTALQALRDLTYDEAMFKKMWDFNPDFALAAKYDLPCMLVGPLYHLKHYAEALASILEKATRSHDHFVRRSVPLLQDALCILKPAGATITPEKYPMVEKRETYLAFPSMEARVSHAHFARLHNTIDGVQGIELYKSRYNLLHQGNVVLDDKSHYVFALEHVLILCKENSTKKSYRFKLRSAIPTKDLRITMDQCCSKSYVIVFATPDKTMRLKAGSSDAYEAWLSTLARIISRGYVAKTVRQKLEDFERNLPDLTRLRVLNVLKQWVDKHFYDFESDKTLLRELLQFIQREVRSDAQRERQCQAVIRVIKNKKSKKASGQDASEHTKPPPDHLWLPVESNFLHVMTLHPIEVARQLTIIDSGLYRAIKPSELVGQQWNKADKESKSPNVLAFIRHFNHVSRWAIRTILEMSDLEERQLVLQSFLEVLFELRHLNNFNSLMALKEALRNSAISRLKHTWAAVPERKMEKFAAIEEEVGGSNHANLRATIAQASPPCIPFLGLYLTDITFMEDGSPDYLSLDPSAPGKDVQGSDIINFSKRRLVGETCMTIQQFQNRTYNLATEDIIKEFLLRLPPVHERAQPLPDGSKASIQQFEDIMYEQSLKLEPRGAATATAGEKLFQDTKDFKVCRDSILSPHNPRLSVGHAPGEERKSRTWSLRALALGSTSSSSQSPRRLALSETSAEIEDAAQQAQQLTITPSATSTTAQQQQHHTTEA
ncbi:hypothetical protein PTSG_01442 [Salpingoeca rosetta]|uniref:Uncharacterized protein n=1 Tax=Salpingoeca rosetta (strain ATCC 50818 / BSB-021) TaxID=946362 RepID=F2U0C8_SALR5|nr:uncharacterized protein PTSG_01442 [Salpingoeca rosetta]EGD80856.1 hypothetical protein PTSG_01442 [Salpingoeca rosetta]|eukprot:XP_004997417.1 hypothetical protein PTSG_01442 [Salpingoeca rosetta]